MKNWFEHLDKAFESKVRLGIMSLLMMEDSQDFTTLRESLGITDGNLASHLKALEKLEYVAMEKMFVGRKPKTKYSATKLGRKAFKNHLSALESMLNSGK